MGGQAHVPALRKRGRYVLTGQLYPDGEFTIDRISGIAGDKVDALFAMLFKGA